HSSAPRLAPASSARVFDEALGILYDGDYSAAWIPQGLPQILPIPNTLVLHLRNRSQGCGNLSAELWKDVRAVSERKYRKGPGDLKSAKGYSG
ncbi:MAG TPA: hypothetical protein VLK33_02945, partial [Terriglobales bacterium]|nr:hypothetical protein [Terriglobales bacterium]